MSYKHDLQDQMRFMRCIDRITVEAKKLQNITDRAELYQVLMTELLENNYHSADARFEFYSAIEDWARHKKETVKQSNDVQ